jgi:hypothetical protein
MDIKTLGIIDGSLPPRVLGLVFEWADQHRMELLDNWKSLSESGTFKKI